VRTPPALRRWLCRVASQCDPSFQGHRRRLISKPVGFCRAKPARWLAYGSISAMPVGVRGCGPASCLNGGSCARRGRALARHYSLCRLAVWFGEPRRASGSKSHRQLSGLPSSLFPRPSTLDPRPSTFLPYPLSPDPCYRPLLGNRCDKVAVGQVWSPLQRGATQPTGRTTRMRFDPDFTPRPALDP
jgi:hypothetical protein